MGRRGGVQDFFDGFNQSYGSVRKVLQDRELMSIAKAKPETIEGQVNDPDGAFVAPTQHKFLGQTSNVPLNEAQVSNARTMAMAGTMKKFGDPMGGLRLEQQAKQGERDAIRDEQDGQRFRQEQENWAQQKRNQQLQDKDRANEDDHKAKRLLIMQNSPSAKSEAKFQADTAEFKEATNAYNASASAPGMEARDMPNRGLPPVAPTRQSPSVGDTLRHYSALVDLDAQAGKLSTEGIMSFGAKLKAIEEEGYGNAIKMLNAGRPLVEVAKAFDSVGAARFDPKSVLSDKMVSGPDGVPSRVISFRQADGELGTINGLQEADAIGQADKTYKRFYDSQTNNRANATAVLAKNTDVRADKSLAITAGNAAVSNALGRAQLVEVQQKTKDREALSTIHADLVTAVEAGDKAAETKARAKLMTYTIGTKGVQMSEIERKANFFLASGAAKTPAEAANMAHQKVQSSPKDDYLKLTTGAMPLQGGQLTDAMRTMHGDDWQSKVRSDGGAKAPEFASGADLEAAVKAGKIKKGDKVIVNGRSATWQ